MTNRLEELAARVEAATGPDRDLERAIKAALLGREYISFEDDLAKKQAATPPQYTASLDAAMTLIPDDVGVGFQVGVGAGCSANAGVWCISAEGAVRADDEGFPLVEWSANGAGATPALALTAACLRARSTLLRGKDHG